MNVTPSPKNQSCSSMVHVTQVRSGSSWMGMKRRSVSIAKCLKGPGQVCVGGLQAWMGGFSCDSHRWRLCRPPISCLNAQHVSDVCRPMWIPSAASLHAQALILPPGWGGGGGGGSTSSFARFASFSQQQLRTWERE